MSVPKHRRNKVTSGAVCNTRHLRSHPGATHLDVEGGRVAAECQIGPHVDAVLSGQLVAETAAPGDDALRVVEVLEVVPGVSGSDEAEDAEALPKLPAQLPFERKDLVALVTHHWYPAQADIGLHVEGRVAEAGGALQIQPEVE